MSAGARATATVPAKAMVREGLKAVTAGMSPTRLAVASWGPPQSGPSDAEIKDRVLTRLPTARC